MKRIYAKVLCVAMAFVLAGCGDSTKSGSKQDDMTAGANNITEESTPLAGDVDLEEEFEKEDAIDGENEYSKEDITPEKNDTSGEKDLTDEEESNEESNEEKSNDAKDEIASKGDLDVTVESGVQTETPNAGSSHTGSSNTGSTTTPDNNTGEDTDADVDSDQNTEAYHLIWNDEFDGEALNTAIWNYEIHEPGWVNNELQEYTNSTDNIFLRDGKLVIKAIKTTDESGDDYYTSGKVTTQNKQNFTYGKVVVSAKVSEGQGLWPAIWMMPADESFYGQWPKCGEIDIMEVLGHQPNVAYGTIHYGEPHEEQQGTYILESGSFADSFHEFSVEWEPGEMRFYVDGILYHTVNDWFTAKAGEDEVAYPAPFDQPFYVQLNQAVGGNWPGNPDETTDFDNAEFEIDYVRVYQLETYDTDVTKPVAEMRDPDSTGNYVNNASFTDAEDLSDDANWKFLLAEGGVGNASIADAKMTITSTAAGTQDYSVQLVQAGLPMQQGGQYKLTFDAYASEARDIKVAVTGPDKSWIRYLTDTRLTLDTRTESYSFEFTVTTASDANGRLEFNLGNQGSVADVVLTNVRLEKVGEIVIDDEANKTVMSDGNYVYNGEFQTGNDRMKYWHVENGIDGANVQVSNENLVRELQAVVPAGSYTAEQLKVYQPDLAITPNTDYVLAFDAYGLEDKTIRATVDGNTFDVNVTATKQTYRFDFTTGGTVTDNDLAFLLGVAGATYIDNVKITESGTLINGSFTNGFTAWTPFADASVSTGVSYAVDSLTEDDAAGFTIQNTGTQNWHIQLMQHNVLMENGKTYRLSFDAKSTIVRDLEVGIQHDGSADNDYTQYCNTTVALSSSYQHFEKEFTMAHTTDAASILNFSMGAVGGKQITETHTIYIDNVVLEEIEKTSETPTPAPEETPGDTPEETPGETPDAGAGEMLKDSNTMDSASWVKAITAPGAANVSAEGEKITFAVTSVGDADWNVQLKQDGLNLENGKTYTLTMKLNAENSRVVRLAFLSSTYAWYGGEDIALEAGVEKEYTYTFTMNQATDANTSFVLSMGKIEDTTPTGAVEISSLSLKEFSSPTTTPEPSPEETPEETPNDTPDAGAGEMLVDTNTMESASWVKAITAPGAADVTTDGNKITFTVTNVGDADWNVQLKQDGINLENGKTYTLTMKLKAENARTLNMAFLSSTYAWYGGEYIVLEPGVEKEYTYTFTMNQATDANTSFVLSMGKIDDTTPTGSVEISNISLIEVQ